MGTLSAAGEVIRLKNGDVIYADEARESGSSVTYEIGDNTFTIPKSRVERIEKLPLMHDRATHQRDVFALFL